MYQHLQSISCQIQVSGFLYSSQIPTKLAKDSCSFANFCTNFHDILIHLLDFAKAALPTFPEPSFLQIRAS